jgi:NhaP-type Na+/H+ or K+/H+ antiporter
VSLVIVFVALLFLYSLASRRLERTVLTAPMVFTGAGIVVLLCLPTLRQRQGDIHVFLQLAEVGLVLLLFTDASPTDLGVLKSIRNLPLRLLTTGMLLILLLGGLGARLVFPSLSLWEAGILAAILAPTDAGLGQIIVTSPRVPLKIRQALNVEAGLNDGLSVPFLLFFIALADASPDGHRASLVWFIVEQLGFGILVGLGVGRTGGWLLGRAHREQWMGESWQQLGVVMLPLLALAVSDALGASMFIAAFVAGLAVQGVFPDAGRHGVEFTEEWGQALNLSVFFTFGMLVARDWRQFTLPFALYAILSLTVVRMVPVAVALRGAGLSRATILFMGWFGPRGLASIVLGLVYLEESQRGGEPTIRLAVMATVLLSILAHGLSAVPAWPPTRAALRRWKPMHPSMAEHPRGTSCPSVFHGLRRPVLDVVGWVAPRTSCGFGSASVSLRTPSNTVPSAPPE